MVRFTAECPVSTTQFPGEIVQSRPGRSSRRDAKRGRSAPEAARSDGGCRGQAKRSPLTVNMLGEVGSLFVFPLDDAPVSRSRGTDREVGVEAVGFEPTSFGFQSRCLCRNATVPSEYACRARLRRSSRKLSDRGEFGSSGFGCIDGIRTHNIRIKSPSSYRWATLQNRPLSSVPRSRAPGRNRTGSSALRGRHSTR